MNGLQEAINNWNDFYNGCKSFFQGCGNTFNFVNRCFTEDRFLINNIKQIAPGAILLTLGILIILKLLGFKNTGKWIGLALVIALLIAAI